MRRLLVAAATAALIGSAAAYATPPAPLDAKQMDSVSAGGYSDKGKMNNNNFNRDRGNSTATFDANSEAYGTKQHDTNSNAEGYAFTERTGNSSTSQSGARGSASTKSVNSGWKW